MEKEKYENIKAIKAKMSKNEKTTFAERNIVNMYDKAIRNKDQKEKLSKLKQR